MNRYRTELLDQICRLGILEMGEVQLKATKSIFKVNLRTLEHKGPLVPSAVKAIAAEMVAVIQSGEGINFDLVCGLPKAGEPFAEIISEIMARPLLRLKKEGVGEKRKITGIAEGQFSPGQAVLLVDDVLMLGDSKEEAVIVVRNAGLVVSDILVVVDRCQADIDFSARIDCRVSSVFTIFQILLRQFALGLLSEEKCDELKTHVSENRATH